MQKLLWRNSEGEELDLTNHTEYGVTEWEGFAGTDLNIQSQQVPFQDGSVFLDALLSERELTVTLAMKARTLKKRYELRRELIHKLNPKLGEGVLIYQNDFIKKQIKCVPHIPIFETHNSDTVGTPKASLSWTANNPYWEDTEETIVKFQGSGRQQIEYDGDVEAGVDLQYIGYSSSLRFENMNEQKKISLTGIGTNRKIDISTRAGNKTVFATDLSKSVLYSGFWYSDAFTENNKLFFYSGAGYLVLDEGDIIKIITPPLGRRFNPYWNLITYCHSKDEYYVYENNNRKWYKSSDLVNWEQTTYAYKDVGTWIARFDEGTGVSVSSDGETWTSSNAFDFLYVEDAGYFALEQNTLLFKADGLTSMTSIDTVTSPQAFLTIFKFNNLVVVLGDNDGQKFNFVYEGSTKLVDFKMFGLGVLTKVVRFNNQDLGWLEGTENKLIDVNYRNLEGLKYQGQSAFPFTAYKNKLYLLLKDTGYPPSNTYGYTENLETYVITPSVQFQTAVKINDLYVLITSEWHAPFCSVYLSSNLKEMELLQYQLPIQSALVIMRDNYICGESIEDQETLFYRINEDFTLTRIGTGMRTSYLNNFRIIDGVFYLCMGNGLFTSTDLENWTQSYSGEDIIDVAKNTSQLIVIANDKYYVNGEEVTVPENFKKVEWSDYYQKFLFISDTSCYASMNGYDFEQVTGIEGDLIDVMYDEKQTLWWIMAQNKLYTYYMDLLTEIDISGEEAKLCLTNNGVAIIGPQIQEVIYSKSANLIAKIGEDSDLSLSLKRGTNILTFTGGETDCLFLTYRRKYLGV